jgi:alpha-L-fucosidase
LAAASCLLSLAACSVEVEEAPAQQAAQAGSVLPPRPILPIPTARQLEWQRAEMALFLHFGVNTYTDREWGTGGEDPDLFHPRALDVGQWARVARETGFRTLILTAKHHDGFALWPSRYTEHSVRASDWRDGGGDVVLELAERAREEGLRLGLYLSPWDRHEPAYGDELAYNQFYLGQLAELLTDYGPVAEVWFDGAKGPEAKDMEYDFDAYWALVRQLQPAAVIFSDEGPDVRWIGNEHGFAGSTNWSMLDRSKTAVGNADTEYLNRGDPDGRDWVPGECDVSIRKGWFWHEDQRPKELEDLLEIYFNSVGRNCALLLNVPPNREGLLDAADVARLHDFRHALDEIFRVDVAAGKPAVASNVRGGSPEFAAAATVDGDPSTYWAADDSVRRALLEFDLGVETAFNLVRIQEPIQLGQRVSAYRIEAMVAGGWQALFAGTTIGYKKLDRVETTTARHVRLVIVDSRGTPLISEFGIHLDPRR